MTLAEKNQSFFQKHHKFLAALLAIALPYAGFNGYQEVQKAIAPAPAGNVSVAITQEAPTGPSTIVNTSGGGLSQIEIQVLIDKVMDAHQGSRQYHEFQQ